ncbi:MAG: hypothetical protein E6Q36_02250 [Chryseobacterium sp.]|nr:MAG: hypothetical protein E6Q36_02250 [Chryseobacterium sp.]
MKKPSLWQRLFNRPKYIQVMNEPGKSLHIIEIDKESDNLIDAMGMTRERAMELRLKVDAGFIKHKNIVSIAEELSQECKHANELFFVTYSISQKIQSHNHIGGIIGRIMAGPSPDQ